MKRTARLRSQPGLETLFLQSSRPDDSLRSDVVDPGQNQGHRKTEEGEGDNPADGPLGKPQGRDDDVRCLQESERHRSIHHGDPGHMPAASFLKEVSEVEHQLSGLRSPNVRKSKCGQRAGVTEGIPTDPFSTVQCTTKSTLGEFHSTGAVDSEAWALFLNITLGTFGARTRFLGPASLFPEIGTGRTQWNGSPIPKPG